MEYISAHNLTKHYGKDEARITAIRDISFGINRGEFAAIMGESGSGKSTLLSIMGGLSAPSQGGFVVDGQDVYALSREKRSAFRRNHIGFVFQNFYLVPYLTVIQNVMLPLAAVKMKSRKKRAMALEALDYMGLAEKAFFLPSQISGGQQERAALARAIVNHPPILLADEPTGNLDEGTSGKVMEQFQRLNDEGMTIIMVTHSAFCAAYARRVLRMADGRIKDDWTAPLLKAG